MSNSMYHKNQQALMSQQELKADNYNGLSRRNWIRKAAITATGAVLLLFILAGCTKERWDTIVPGPPGGGVGGTPDQWYYLQADYVDRHHQTWSHPYDIYSTGYLGPTKTILYPDYVEIGGDYTDKYKLHPAGDGWAYWETTDGHWLSITGSGWLYNNSDSTKKVAWKIVDGKLYNLYWSKENWKDYPAGARRDLSIYDPVYGTTEYNYFVGVGLDEKYTLTNCKLIPVP